MLSGVYAITNQRTGKRYIGSSMDIEQRWRAHRYLLNSGKHACTPLLNAWRKHGASAFAFDVIAEVPDAKARLDAEQKILDAEKSRYNVALTTEAVMTGRQHSEEAKAKMRGTRLKWSEHARAQIMASRGVEWREKLRRANTGKKQSDETKRRISTALAGRRPSLSAVAKAVEANTGRRNTPEAIEQMRLAHWKISHDALLTIWSAC